MSTFRFRLSSIMRLRVRERDKAAQALQQAQLAKQKLLDEIASLERESQQQASLRSQASLGQVDIQRLLDVQRYQMNLLEDIRSIQSNVVLIDGNKQPETSDSFLQHRLWLLMSAQGKEAARPTQPWVCAHVACRP